MIAFVPRPARARPAYVIGGEVPQLGGNAGTGEGWLVVEGDESDRTIAALRAADRRRHERGSGSPQRVRLARRGGERSSTTGSPRVPTVVRGDELPPLDGELAVPGEHNRRNAAAALAALEAAGVERERAVRALAEFAASAGGSSGAARPAASPSTTTTRTTRRRSRRRSRRCARRRPAAACSSSSSRTSPSRTRHVAHELGAALAGADAVAVTDDLRGARVAGRGRERASRGRGDPRPAARDGGRRGRPSSPTASRYLARHARAGDVVATVGAGDVDRGRAAAARGARVKIEEGVALARFTTLGTGGPARCVRAAGDRSPSSRRRSRWAARARAARRGRSGSARTCSSPTRAWTGSC